MDSVPPKPFVAFLVFASDWLAALFKFEPECAEGSDSRAHSCMIVLEAVVMSSTVAKRSATSLSVFGWRSMLSGVILDPGLENRKFQILHSARSRHSSINAYSCRPRGCVRLAGLGRNGFRQRKLNGISGCIMHIKYYLMAKLLAQPPGRSRSGT